ncbi:cupredoxin domain-containing protein [Thauera sp. SDU_THAU2]|uniref:cupredoxin domain-containing protein n=1 Tax=Thauera sp. SDU_THAU2 TaxID=3136633 RepID=UPI00311DB72B
MKTKWMTRQLRAGMLAGLMIAGGAWAAEHEVRIVQYAYTPAELTIKAGDTVTWINDEKRVSHSVLFRGSGEESERFFPGERWSRKFEQAGRYEYTCGPHPEMKGLIVVEP